MSFLKSAGFFQELEHGDPDGPSLVEARERLDPSLRETAAAYLSRGSVLSTTGQRVDDWFDATNTAIAPYNTQTDGVWHWPGDYAYYVKHYGADVPREFLEHMAGVRWTPPTLSHEELSAIARAVVAEIRARGP